MARTSAAVSDWAAVVISGPVVLHQYLLADPFNSTVTELALCAQAPTHTPLCTAYIGSCP